MCCCAEYSALKEECASSAEQVGWISLDFTDPSKSLPENFQKFLAYSFQMTQFLLIANEVEAERGLGNIKLIPSPTANVFLEGGSFADEGDVLLQRSGHR